MSINWEMDAETLANALDGLAEQIRRARNTASEETLEAAQIPQPDTDLERYLTLLRFWGENEKNSTEMELDRVSADPKDMRRMADLGLTLVYNISQWAEYLQLEEMKHVLEAFTLSLTLWTVRNIGPVSFLDPVVTALTDFANRQSDPELLAELSDIMGEIIEAVAPEIKEDLDKSDPARPWRLLNLNQGIVATRSLDPRIMEQVFEQILLRLPEDAPAFFQEGWEQMEIVGYPEHVRNVMEKYYQLTNKPTLH